MADEVRGFTPANARRVARQTSRVEKWSDPPWGNSPAGGPIFPPPGIWIRNDSEEEIPRYAVMAVVDDDYDSQAGFEQVLLVVGKPSTTFRRRYLVNGYEPIPEGKTWFILWEPQPRFAYDSSWGTPAAGDSGGPKPDSWLLWKNYPAICTVGGVRDATNRYLEGTLEPITTLLGKANGAITARSGTTPGTGTMDIFYVSGTTLTDTTVDVTVKNLSATAVTASAYIQAKWIGGAWYVDFEDCP